MDGCKGRRSDRKEVQEFQRGAAEINRLFLGLAEEGLMEYRDHWPKRSPAENIAWVAGDKTCRRKFRRILEGLDESEAPHLQAAYLLRAFSGLQVFPDANHRTGVVVVTEVLARQGWRWTAPPNELVKVVEAIRDETGHLSARRTVDRLRERDASFVHLATFMEQHIRRENVLGRLARVLGFLPRKRRAQKLPLHLLQVPETVEQEARRKRRA